MPIEMHGIALEYVIEFSERGRNKVLQLTAEGVAEARAVWDGLQRGGFEMKCSRP